jgi:hypothetical protein
MFKKNLSEYICIACVTLMAVGIYKYFKKKKTELNLDRIIILIIFRLESIIISEQSIGKFIILFLLEFYSFKNQLKNFPLLIY